MRCPTVRVKDANSPDGYIVINESDLTDKHEVVQPEPLVENVPDFAFPQLGGTRGDTGVDQSQIMQPIGQPTVFDNTAEAPFNRQASLAPGQTVVVPGGTAIPSDWESLQWKKQVKLAQQLGLNDVSSIHKAKEFIRSKVAERDGNNPT